MGGCSMYHLFVPGLVLVALLLGGPLMAQDAVEQAPQQTDGKSLGDPGHKQRADDAMSTPSGRAGRDEPGAHAPTRNEPVLKDGRLNVPGAPTQSETTPASSHNPR